MELHTLTGILVTILMCFCYDHNARLDSDEWIEDVGGDSLVPRPPFNTARGKGGLVNIVQHFCRSAEFRRDNLIG